MKINTTLLIHYIAIVGALWAVQIFFYPAPQERGDFLPSMAYIFFQALILPGLYLLLWYYVLSQLVKQNWVMLIVIFFIHWGAMISMIIPNMETILEVGYTPVWMFNFPFYKEPAFNLAIVLEAHFIIVFVQILIAVISWLWFEVFAQIYPRKTRS